MTKKSKKQSFGTGWVTTDDDERNIRRERARTEKMSVRFLGGGSVAPFGDYEVASEDGGLEKSYRVELRSLNAPVNSCSCPDFGKNWLGTCKHIERVLLSASRNADGAGQSPCGEVFVSGDPPVVRFLRGDAMPRGTAESVSRLFTRSGSLKTATPAGIDSLLATCERLNRKSPGAVRVSPDVAALGRAMRDRESLSSAVGRFASKMASSDGRWPFLKTPLYTYQVEGALHLASKGRAILADEMGLGKTVQAIAAALLLREVAGIRRVLAVVPASLKGEWADQMAIFSDATTALLSGGRKERLAAYGRPGAFFLIANYEQVVRDWKEINERLRPDLVILDEAQRIKNWQTKTARTLKRLESRFAFVLTGTPLENRIDEFYSIAEFVDPSLFGSLFRFNRAYYKFDANGKSTGMQNLDDLHDKAMTIMLRRRKDMVEDELPGRTDKNYFVPMTDEQTARYREYEDKVARLCSLTKRRPLTKEEMDRLQQYLACMRMLCDSCYILDAKKRESPKADEALRVLDDIFSSDPGRKVVVFSEWVRMLELLEERLEENGIGFAVHTGSVRQDRRRAELRRFKSDPDCRVLLSSESGGVGLNLQSASVVMNLDLPWNPAKLEQRIARAWRKRQSRDVLVVNLVAEGTIEQKMLATLKFKQGLADLVLDARGDATDFESEKSRNAFIARVTSLMDAQLPAVSRADGTQRDENGGTAAVQSSGADGESRGNAAGSSGGGDAAASVAADDPLTDETLAMLARLEKLGLVTLGDEVKRRLAETGGGAMAADLDGLRRSRAAERRKAVAAAAMEKARRSMRMGDVLAAGGFADEAAAPFCEAVTLAAGAALFAADANDAAPEDVPDAVAPVAMDTLVQAVGKLDLQPDAVLTLQFAAQRLPMSDAAARVKSFVEECSHRI